MSNESSPQSRVTEPEPSLLEVVQRFARLLVAIISTRIALLGADAVEARQRLVRGVVFALVSAMLAFLGVTFISVAVLVYFWDSNRMVAAIAVPLVFVAGALIFYFAGASAIRDSPRAFAASIETLRADRDSLLRTSEPAHVSPEQ